MANLRSVRLENALGVSSTIPPDQQVASILFDSLQVSIGGRKAEPLVQTKSASLVALVNENEGDLTICQHIRGYVQVNGNARAVLITHMAGQTHIVDLPENSLNGEDFLREIKSTLSAGVNYRVTFFLLVERDSEDPDISATLQVDSIDVKIE